ncbi:MAG: P-II family nitrogen regulator [Epsilonproteobacteria bacterium]|nr:P-II family nitrogen regulator [Campylobacterota bacterium]
MKKIEAIIRPYKLEELKEALSQIEISGITITPVKGYGRQQGHSELYRGAEYLIDFIPKIKVEIVVESKDVERVVDTIIKSSRSGKIGDGKIFILEVTKAVRIRTGQEDKEALS